MTANEQRAWFKSVYEAFLKRDATELHQLATDSKLTEATREVLHQLIKSSTTRPDHAEKQTALSSPGLVKTGDVDLDLLYLCVIAMEQLNQQGAIAAQPLIYQLVDRLEEARWPETKSLIRRLQANYHGYSNQPGRAIDVLTHALNELGIERNSLERWKLLYHRATLRSGTAYYEEAEEDILEMERFIEHEAYASKPLEQIRLSLDIEQGRLEPGLSRVEKLRERIADDELLMLHFSLLIGASAWDQLESLLESEQGLNLAKPYIDFYRARIALGRGMPEIARQHSRSLLQTENVAAGYFIQFARGILIEAALIARDHEDAKQRLQAIDPYQESDEYVIAWVRLDLLLGNREAAFRRARQFLNRRGHRALAQGLRVAIELSSGDLADLMQAAFSTKHEQSLDRSPQARQDRLTQLCQVHGRISRKQAATLMSCNPRTAAADLQALEKAGRIRRVNPTPSPRTAYYVPVSPSINKPE